jgi:LuxR family maltose regulon positive regulatory protein
LAGKDLVLLSERDSEISLIRTKLRPPRVATRVVERPRLFERLEDGADLPLTLVSAPAGYGKSTLVASWLVDQGTSRQRFLGVAGTWFRLGEV